MNISSLIVYTDNKSESVKNEIKKLKECEIITDADDRIVVVVSSDSIEDEIKNFKKIDKDAEKYLKDLYEGKNYYF